MRAREPGDEAIAYCDGHALNGSVCNELLYPTTRMEYHAHIMMDAHWLIHLKV